MVRHLRFRQRRIGLTGAGVEMLSRFGDVAQRASRAVPPPEPGVGARNAVLVVVGE